MSNTFTPGPWQISRDAVPEGHVQVTVYAEATGERVATVFERPANALLTAAAPTLFAALSTLTKMVEDGDYTTIELDEARAALRQVEG